MRTADHELAVAELEQKCVRLELELERVWALLEAENKRAAWNAPDHEYTRYTLRAMIGRAIADHDPSPPPKTRRSRGAVSERP